MLAQLPLKRKWLDRGTPECSQAKLVDSTIHGSNENPLDWLNLDKMMDV